MTFHGRNTVHNKLKVGFYIKNHKKNVVKLNLHSKFSSAHETPLLTCNFRVSTFVVQFWKSLAQVFLQKLLAQVTFARNFLMCHGLNTHSTSDEIPLYIYLGTWIGHSTRKAGSSITKKAPRWTLKVVETEEDQRTHGRGQSRRSWETWNWAGVKQRARHKIGRSIVGGLCSGRSWKAKKKNYTL